MPETFPRRHDLLSLWRMPHLFPGASAYVMTKAAIAGLTHALARELGPRGILAVNVRRAFIASQAAIRHMTAGADPDRWRVRRLIADDAGR